VKKALITGINGQDSSYLAEFLVEKYNGNSPIIVSPSHEISIKDLVDLIVEISNFKGKVIYDKARK
tara:strand:- start:465 stop:662 length:198 start_codon:yes stop_codon:yes gene_type:complete